MTDETKAEAGDGKVETPTTEQPAGSSSALKGLQRVISEKDRELAAAKAELAKIKGEPSLEEKYTTLQGELQTARQEAETAKAKAEHPELADVIDTWVAKGQVPDRDVLAVLATKVSLQHPETSGIRNAPSQTTVDKDDTERQRLLKSEPLW